jgi:hypothetical protein
MEVICSFETSVDFQRTTTTLYINSVVWLERQFNYVGAIIFMLHEYPRAHQSYECHRRGVLFP